MAFSNISGTDVIEITWLDQMSTFSELGSSVVVFVLLACLNACSMQYSGNPRGMVPNI